MVTVLTIIFTVAAIAATVVTVATATFTVQIDGERTAVFYGYSSFCWYRKNCGTRQTRYQLIKIEGLF